jgi:5-dehydro-4-deoxyglucarate dehydratase
VAELRFSDGGPLFFPVTPFDDRNRVATDELDEHLTVSLSNKPGGVFIACGTGEFHALSGSEFAVVVGRGVTAAARRVPVVAATGGPLGHAIDCARSAEQLGADGLLVMPPYLVNGPQAGLRAYIEAIAQATALPLIVYHRGPATLSVDTVERLLGVETVVGFKDGVGDVALAQEFVLAAARSGRDDILFFNGLLTAELSQRAYRAIGVPLYSSAVFAMAPAVARAFYDAYLRSDEVGMQRLLDGFYAPLVRLRDRVPGYAVSLIKAGLRLGGTAVGSVRPPLIDPDASDTAELRRILDIGAELVRG